MSTPAPNNQLIKTKRDIRDLINADSTRAELAKVLPKHLTPDRMARVVLTAIMKVPALMDCTQESLLQCMMLCSQAGLEPDGRLAHLIPYGKIATVIFDYKGLVTLALRNGAEAVYGDKVCEADEFEAGVRNGVKKIDHVVCYKKARGDAYAYYAVCQRGGVVDWEVMTKEEVDLIRARSKAGRSGPWVTDYDEMAKKTVLRRMSKRWDLLPEIRDVINADDDVPEAIKAPMMKPVFDASPLAPAGESEPEEHQKAAAGNPNNEGAQNATPPASADAAMPTNYVKAVRGLCKMSAIHEGMLLDFLTDTGSTDGSVATLEELAMYQNGGVIKMVYDQWSGEEGLASKIKSKKQ